MAKSNIEEQHEVKGRLSDAYPDCPGSIGKDGKTYNYGRFVAAGKSYHSAVAACKELGVNYRTYRTRVKRGLNVEQALGLSPFDDRRNPIYWAKDRGRSKKSLSERIDYVQRKYPGLYERLGSVSDRVLAEEYGLRKASLWNMRRRLGVTPSHGHQKGGASCHRPKRAEKHEKKEAMLTEGVKKAINLISEEKYSQAKQVLLGVLVEQLEKQVVLLTKEVARR